MSNWQRIKDYQRMSWKAQAVYMDALGTVTVGVESGYDNTLADHNLTSTVTDANGRTYTATSVGNSLGVSGTFTGGLDPTLLIDDPDAPLPNSD